MAITLSGSDGSQVEIAPDPEGRIRRLTAVLYAVDRGSLGSKVESKICRLNDHKGTLQVSWSEQPTFGEMLAVSRAWEDVGLESISEHEIGGRLIASCDSGRWDVNRSASFDIMAAESPENMTINPFMVL